MPTPLNRLAQNRATFREVNKRIRELSLQQELVPWVERAEYFCECDEAGCLETIELTPAEFEAARSDESTFVISPGHVSPAFAIVEEMRGYLIVERYDR